MEMSQIRHFSTIEVVIRRFPCLIWHSQVLRQDPGMSNYLA